MRMISKMNNITKRQSKNVSNVTDPLHRDPISTIHEIDFRLFIL